MKLKLAEYKDGKFERFLEIGKDFAYCGEFILYYHTRLQGHFVMPRDVLYKQQLEERKLEYQAAKYRFIEEKEETTFIGQRFEKDEKDPLCRFDGLFDGRTYGGGRFVLIKNNEDDVENIELDGRHSINTQGFTETITNSYVFIGETLGNLHENPEFWDKLNNN